MRSPCDLRAVSIRSRVDRPQERDAARRDLTLKLAKAAADAEDMRRTLQGVLVTWPLHGLYTAIR